MVRNYKTEKSNLIYPFEDVKKHTKIVDISIVFHREII